MRGAWSGSFALTLVPRAARDFCQCSGVSDLSALNVATHAYRKKKSKREGEHGKESVPHKRTIKQPVTVKR